MAFSNQSELLALFSPRQVNLKISHRILPNLTLPEDNLTKIGYHRRSLSENGQILEND
jgi:hypothetical protein